MSAARKVKKLQHHILTPIREFLKDSRAVGIILIGCTVASLVLANLSATQGAYLGFWHHEIHLTSLIHLPEDTLEWVNDVLMSLFFFLVGMEIKRELMVGELASLRKSILPVLAALGGMLVPAFIYWLMNGGTPFSHGWGIPMATDIAFSLGILSLLGKKVPIQLKIFLAALAIIDDLGAVITIAVFYTEQLNFMYLLCGGGALLAVLTLNLLKVRQTWLYLIPALVLWYCIFNSGVHATIAGVIMAFAMPLNRLEKLEHQLYHPVNFVIMPLFALANTAIILPSSFAETFTSPVSLGVILGLVIGKPVGIFLFSYTAIKARIASLPAHTNFKQLLGVGLLGGIGFTMSIFTAGLAFSLDSIQVISKVGIILASLVSSLAGYFYLSQLLRAKRAVPREEKEEAADAHYRATVLKEKKPAMA